LYRYDQQKEARMKNLKEQAARPFHLFDSKGDEHVLEDYLGQWLLMVFHRHLG